MLKQLIALIVLSIIVVFFMQYAQLGIQALMNAYQWVSNLLTDVFSGGQAGNYARGFMALLAIPMIAALIPAIFYWIVRKHWFPYFMEVIWFVWLLQAGALLALYKAAV